MELGAGVVACRRIWFPNMEALQKRDDLSFRGSWRLHYSHNRLGHRPSLPRNQVLPKSPVFSPPLAPRTTSPQPRVGSKSNLINTTDTVITLNTEIPRVWDCARCSEDQEHISY